MDWHAQYEIRAYADVMAMMAKAVAPQAYKAFENHLLHGVRLSRAEVKAVRALIAGTEPTLKPKALAELREKLGLEADAAASDAERNAGSAAS
jgi:thymidylate synthase (FAD)